VKRIAMVMAAALVAGAMTPGAGRAAAPAGGEGDAITQFSQASKTLYTKVSASMIRVKLEHNPAALLSDPMRKEFEDWLRQQGLDKRPPRMAGAAEGRARPGRLGDPATGSSTQPGPGYTGLRREGLLRRFLEEKAGAAGDTETSAKYRRLLTGLDALRGALPTEALGVVIDNDGNAIVLGPGVRESQKDKPFAVTGPDGKETTARYVGAHFARGLTVVKLDSPSVAPPLELADTRPDTGELLMCVAGSNDAVAWVTVPGRAGKPVDDRFATTGGDDHGPSYLFNAAGQLSAVGYERFALPVEMLKENIHWIIENQRDLKPRQLGVKYRHVPQDSPLRSSNPVVGKNPAVVVVEDVFKGSGAEQAGMQKGDLLVSIDGRPLWQIGQILSDLATRTGKVPLGVVRQNKEITLEMPLEAEK
jgi:hypothetical protein